MHTLRGLLWPIRHGLHAGHSGDSADSQIIVEVGRISWVLRYARDDSAPAAEIRRNAEEIDHLNKSLTMQHSEQEND